MWSCCPPRASSTRCMAGYLRDGITRCRGRMARPAVVIQLDTPGGSLDATRDIVQALLDAPLPVIVWVGAGGRPGGQRGHVHHARRPHVAAMAPGTNIGAATPGRRPGRGHRGRHGRQGPERHDRVHHGHRRGARSARSTGR